MILHLTLRAGASLARSIRPPLLGGRSRRLQGDETMVAITYAQLPKSVKKGQRILVQERQVWIPCPSFQVCQIHDACVSRGPYIYTTI